MNLHEELAAKDSLITTQSARIAELEAQLAAAQAPVREVPGWISVDEQLPEKRDRSYQVIAVCKKTYAEGTNYAGQGIKAWTERMHGLKTLSPTHAMQAEIADLRAALSAAPASPQPVAKVLEEIQELQAEIMRVTAANAILIQRIVNGCTAIEVGAMADNDKSPSDYKQGIAKGASDCLKFIQEQRKRAASTPTTLTGEKE